jgi:hypothetical protein
MVAGCARILVAPRFDIGADLSAVRRVAACRTDPYIPVSCFRACNKQRG